MKRRLLLHLVVFAALIGIGVWIAYRGVVSPGPFGPVTIDLDVAAMYWFALLIYAFVGLMLYYPLCGRLWWVLLIGHGFAAGIALVSTTTVVMLGHRHSPAPSNVPAVSTQASNTASDADALSGQPLALPEPRRRSGSQGSRAFDLENL
jgi:hypothetical protein